VQKPEKDLVTRATASLHSLSFIVMNWLTSALIQERVINMFDTLMADEFSIKRIIVVDKRSRDV